MDPVSLATTITTFLIPYLTKIGGSIAEQAGDKLWDVITKKFNERPAASSAATELASEADDPGKQKAFAAQLELALKNDPGFAKEIADLLDQAGNAGIVNKDGVIATNGSVAVGDIQVSGGVRGNLVVGSGNSISQTVATSANKPTGRKSKKCKA